MKFHHTIVTTGRPDLLMQAVRSIEPLWQFTSILDNSPGAKISQMDWPVPVIRSSVPLSCAQSMNFLQRLAVERGLDAWGYQHEDVVAPPGKAELFLSDVAAAVEGGKRWAVVFTSYDLISGYSPAAVAEIGPWDDSFPDPNYYIDTDWFHRARLAGYELTGWQRPESRYDLIHLEGGSSSSKEYSRRVVRDAIGNMNNEYYAAKWGGPPHVEVYAKPWGSSVNEKIVGGFQSAE